MPQGKFFSVVCGCPQGSKRLSFFCLLRRKILFRSFSDFFHSFSDFFRRLVIKRLSFFLSTTKEYIFLQGILERNVFEDEQNFPRDNFSLSAIISKLSAERSEARHSWWSRKGKSWPKESFVRPRKQFPFAVYPRGIHFLALQGVVHHPSRNW